MSTAYEVTFRLVRPLSPASPEVSAALAEIVREAAGLSPELPTWKALDAKLRAGDSIRVRVGAVQFCRFFLGRRAAGKDGYRLKWSEAVEVEVPEEEDRRLAAVIAAAPTYMEMEDAARGLDAVQQVPRWLIQTVSRMRSSLIDVARWGKS